ncbi:MAG: hypothetical protein Q9196_003619, partial [Gyalolechia fulgens]
LENVYHALHEIEHLQPSPGQESAINSIKIAALLCKNPLDEFAVKLKKYRALGTLASSKKEQLKNWKVKLQWGLTMEEEVQRIRTVLGAHMASLNVRLSTQGIITTSAAIHRIDAVDEKVAQTRDVMLAIRNDTRSQNSAIHQSSSYLHNIIRTVQNSNLVPQMAALLDIANRVWTSNMQIITLLVRLQDAMPTPDTKHTFFQTPCRFEDALGRILRAIISARFSAGPGCEKVLAAEYEVFNTSDTTQILSESQTYALIPGMKITMAIVVGRYAGLPLAKCPRPGCRARTFTKINTGGQTCSACEVWFDLSRQSLPRPFRLISTENLFQRLRADRKWFKNVKICPTEWPILPLKSDRLEERWITEGRTGTTQLIPTKVDEGVRQENLQNSWSSFKVTADDADGQATAAQAIKLISEELDISVDELKDLVFNNSQPGTLGIDSLTSLSIIFQLQDIGLNPLGALDKSGTILDLFVEAYIRDFVKEYWYCLQES